ncbi:MAG: hypothetical protein JWP16_1263 [Alphaproteobacteria bacterium]|jgi:hypothetical protein|nr:hypothetical protein [Alphaproteobacteria bacterium]MDB5740223.1 hypothetical protein [Alphaproteobacteria bacterium]
MRGHVMGSQNDWVRTVCVTVIVVASIILLGFIIDKGLGLATLTPKPDVAPVLALLGAITTFLGSAIGVFFGVRAGQAGVTQTAAAANVSNAAANVSTQVAQTATDIAAAAQKAAATAVQAAATQSASSTGQIALLQSRLNTVYASKTDVDAHLRHVAEGHAQFMSTIASIRPTLAAGVLARLDAATANAPIVVKAADVAAIVVTLDNGADSCSVSMMNGGPTIIISPPDKSPAKQPWKPAPGSYFCVYGWSSPPTAGPGGSISIALVDSNGTVLAEIPDSLPVGQIASNDSMPFFLT